MNLQAQRSRSTQPRRAAEALERDERPGAEGEVHRVPRAEGLERVARRAGDHARGVAIERIRPAVGRLRLPVEAIEKCRSARADDQRAGCGGQQLIESQGRRRPVERGPPEREQDVEPQRPQPRRQRLERTAGRSFARRRAPYRSWKGYCICNPSDAGKVADFTAFSTQLPLGVPANFPETVAEVILPLLPMTTLTIAIPGTLNSL